MLSTTAQMMRSLRSGAAITPSRNSFIQLQQWNRLSNLNQCRRHLCTLRTSSSSPPSITQIHSQSLTSSNSKQCHNSLSCIQSRHSIHTCAAQHQQQSDSQATSSPSTSLSPSSASFTPGGWYGLDPSVSILKLSCRSSGSAPPSPLDLLKYIHNLSTQDIYAAVGDSETESSSSSFSSSSVSFHSYFLNGRGRVLFDGLLVSVDQGSVSWMRGGVTRGPQKSRGPAVDAQAETKITFKPKNAADVTPLPPSSSSASSSFGVYLVVSSASAAPALAHLHAYNLRRRIVIEDVTQQMDVFQIIPKQVFEQIKHQQQHNLNNSNTAAASSSSSSSSTPSIQALLGLSTAEYSSLNLDSASTAAFIDPRTSAFGVRVLRAKQQDSASTAGGLSLPSSFVQLPPASTFLPTLRVVLGLAIAPGEIVFERSLPLEVCGSVEGIPSISFDKGCYMGQELTARTHFQGMVRKKIWPAFVTRDKYKLVNSGNNTIPLLSDLMRTGAGAVPSNSSSSDPVDQLRSYFPFLDPSMPSLASDTPIFRVTATAAAAGDAPPPPPPTSASAADPPAAAEPSDPNASAASSSKEVANVTSSSHNVLLAMLRNEHVQEVSEGQSQLVIQIPTSDAANQAQTLTLTPYQPDWWNSKDKQ